MVFSTGRRNIYSQTVSKLDFVDHRPLKTVQSFCLHIAHLELGSITHFRLHIPQQSHPATKKPHLQQLNMLLKNIFHTCSVKECTPLNEELEKYIHPTKSDPIKRHKLQKYVSAGVEVCHLYLKVEGLPANKLR